MSHGPVKIAIALSVLCLFASIAFYYSSTGEDVVATAPSTDAASPKLAKSNLKVGSGSFGQGHAIHDGSGSDGVDYGAQIDSADPVSGESDDGYVEDAPTDGTIAGRIVAQGELPQDAVIYVVQVKSFDPPEEANDTADEQEAADNEEPEVTGEVDTADQQQAGENEAVPSARVVIAGKEGDIVRTIQQEALPQTQLSKLSSLGEVVRTTDFLEDGKDPEQLAVKDDVADDERSEESDAEPDEGPYLEPVYPDENGEFETFVSPGEYKLIVRAPGYQPVQLEGITVHAGEEVRGLMIELQKGFPVAGYVRTEEQNVNADGVEVVLEGEGYNRVTYTDENGSFSFEGLPAGRFKVRAFDSTMGAAMTEARSGDTAVSLNLRFKHLQGTLYDVHGEPLPYAEVTARGTYLAAGVEKDPYGPIDGMEQTDEAEDRPMWEDQYGTTDENGKFDITVASDSRVMVTAQWDGAYAVAKDVAPDASNVSLRLEPGIEFKVLAHATEAGSGGWVELAPEDPNGGFEIQSQEASEGELTFSAIPGVPYLLYPDGDVKIEASGRLPPNVKIVAAPPEVEEDGRYYSKNAIVY